MRNGVLYWITGLLGAGKTTIGNRLYYELRKQGDNVVLLDGDILRNIVGGGLGHSEADRRKMAMKYALLCRTLVNQGIIVICCTIAMYDEVRSYNRENNKAYVEVFLDVPMDILRKRDQKGMYSKHQAGKLNNLAGVDVNVEFPKNPDLIIKNDGSITVRECIEKILAVNVDFSSDFDRDVGYWNNFYGSKPDIERPSLFALSTISHMHKGKSVLELGCGNGRDSLFFAANGLQVTAVDASDKAIEMLTSESSLGGGYLLYMR